MRVAAERFLISYVVRQLGTILQIDGRTMSFALVACCNCSWSFAEFRCL